VARKLELEGWDDPKVDVLNLVSSWLANAENGNWLILDNADEVQLFSKTNPKETPSSDTSLAKYIPNPPTGCVLATTRDIGLASWLCGGGSKDVVRVEEMSEEEAIELLRKRIKSTSKELRELIRELECIPLALTQAASYIREMGVMFVLVYLKLYREGEATATRLLNKEFGNIIRDHDLDTSSSVTQT
jgi:hypothetical protein